LHVQHLIRFQLTCSVSRGPSAIAEPIVKSWSPTYRWNGCMKPDTLVRLTVVTGEYYSVCMITRNWTSSGTRDL